MNTSKWVQHISGQGEKWEVMQEYLHEFQVVAKKTTTHWLPASEYRLCDPPEQWEDVTGECSVEQVNNDRIRIMFQGLNILRTPHQCRLRMVNLLQCQGDSLDVSSYKPVPCFIVERRKP